MEMRSVVYCIIDFLLVTCLVQLTVQSDGCQLGQVRLVGGNSYLEGRVEYCKNGVWGTVCDDDFDENDASVTCKQLGFSGSGAQVRDQAYFGQGQGSIFLVHLACTGTEAGLGHCPYNHQCGHFEDVGVICINGTNTQGVSLYFKGMEIPDHSLVSLEALISEPLYCVTSKLSCCNFTSTGNWYPPASMNPLGIGPGTPSTLFQTRGDDQSIRLHAFTISSTVNGLYSCVIPDQDNISTTLYVGVYSANEGSIRSVELSYDQASSTLTCTSTGGPATSVSWSKDGRSIQVDGQTIQQSQVVTDTTTATYQSRLTIVQKESSLSGSYKCIVTNARGSNSSIAVSVTVCRYGELRTTTSQESAAQVELCSENTWIQTVSLLRVSSNEEIIRNFALQTTGLVVELTWESDSLLVSGFNVSCSDGSNTFISHLTEEARSASFISLPASLNYECCITALLRRKLENIATYFHTSCLSMQTIGGLDQTLSDQVEATVTYSLTAVIIILIVIIFGLALGCIAIYMSKRNYQNTHQSAQQNNTEDKSENYSAVEDVYEDNDDYSDPYEVASNVAYMSTSVHTSSEHQSEIATISNTAQYLEVVR